MKKICYIVTISLTIKAFFIPQLQYLAENGYDVSVICSPDEELQALLGPKVRFIPVNIPRGLSVGGSMKTISALKKVFKKEKFDMVQYSTPNAALYASLAASAAKIPVRNYHLMGFRYLGASGLGRKLLKCIEKLTCKKSTSIECVSPSNLEFGSKEKIFKKEKATVVWNGSSGGIDLARFCYEKGAKLKEEKRNELGIKDTDFVYGFVGRITRDKGVVELLSAFEKVHAKRTDTRLVLVGNLDENHGFQAETLEKMKSSLDVIHITQKLDIENFYPIFDVLVLPSYREGFGNVVIEAQAMGVPVIVSDIPGPIDAMIDGETGVKVTPMHVDELVTAMQDAWMFQEKGFSKKEVAFVREAFDSKTLCEKILQRKQILLNDNKKQEE